MWQGLAEHPYYQQSDMLGTSKNNLPGGPIITKTEPNALTDSHTHSRPSQVNLEQTVVRHQLQGKKVNREELTVSSLGSGNCTTIQEALDRVDPDGTIYVESGTYRESLQIKRSIRLVARGKDVSIEHCVPCLVIAAQNVTVEGFKIRGIGQEKENPAIQVTAQGCEIKACNISSESTIGVLIHGREARATLNGCKIYDTQKIGVCIEGEGSLELEDCTIEQAGEKGISVSDGAIASLKRCSIKNNKSNGVYVEKGTLIMDKCNITKNGTKDTNDVILRDVAYASLRDCIIGDNYGR
jgi:hypothetical protein